MISQVKKAVLPAAGLGTRFLPATKASPKEMLPIVDKPLIQYAVEEAHACGISEFIVITGKHKRAIEDHFDHAYELEDSLRRSGKEGLLEQINIFSHLNFAYIRQGAGPGPRDTVCFVKPFIRDEPFIVSLGDDLIPPAETLLEDMLRLHEELQHPVVALMRVPKDSISSYGVIEGTEERKGVYRISDLVEKPPPEEAPSDLAIIGRYVLTPDILDILEVIPPGRGGEIQLTDAIRALSEKRPVFGFLYEGRRYDAGSKLGFLEATVDFALRDESLSEAFRKFLLGKCGDSGFS